MSFIPHQPTAVQKALATSATAVVYQDIIIRSILLFTLCFANVAALMVNRLDLLRSYQLVFHTSLCISFMLMLMMMSSLETRANVIKAIRVPVDADEVVNWLAAYKRFRENNTSYSTFWCIVVGMDIASLGDVIFDIDNSDFVLSGTLFGILIKLIWGIHMTYYHNKLAKIS